MSLCYKQNLIFQLRAVRLSIAGYTPHMENVEPTNCGTKFCYGEKNENNKAKRGFHTTSFPILLIVPKYSIVESIRPMRHIYQ